MTMNRPLSLWHRLRQAIGLQIRYAIVQETFAIDEMFEQHVAEEVRFPDRLSVFPTNICNARCTFCQYPSHTDPKSVMDQGIYEKAIDEFIANNGKRLLLTPNNGEPLVDPKLADKIRYARAKGVAFIELSTNGILLGRGDNADNMAELMDEVGISLPGLEPENYRIVYGVDKASEVLNGIVKLAESKRRLGSSVKILLDFRIDRPYEDVLRDEGMQCIKPYMDDGTVEVRQIRCDEMFDWSGLLEETKLTGIMKIRKPTLPNKRLPCNRALTDLNLTVLADGAIRVCNCGRGASNYGELIIGNVRDVSLDKAILSTQHRKLLRDWMRGELPPECVGCAIWQPNPYPMRRIARMALRLLGAPRFWRRLFKMEKPEPREAVTTQGPA